MPRRDDDEFALAAERDRVAAGLEDYVPDDVPPAADPPPPGVSEAVDLAERGLLDDTSIDTPDRWHRSATVSTVVTETYIFRSWWQLFDHGSAWLSVECMSAGAFVAFVTRAARRR
jgi:hypothetical protein